MKKYQLLLILLSLISLSFQTIQSETRLEITVIDGKGKNVVDADIIIYSSEEDYTSKENELIIGQTDKKGRFQYKGLGTRSYFLDVRKDNLSNEGTDVQTGSLSGKKLNRVIVVLK